LRHIGVALGHAGLDLAGAAQRVHDAAELDEQAVARRLYQPAVMRVTRRWGTIDAGIPRPTSSS